MWGRKKKGDPEGAFTALADHGVGRSGDVSPPVQPSALSMLPPVDHARSPPLKELVRRRLHTDMLSSFKNEPAGVVLCVDNFTLRLVSSLYKVSQLAEENFYLVENITMKSERGEYLDRQPMPSLPVLYFITPTVESVNRMLHDYRDKKSPKYGKAHLYFTSHLSDALLLKIKASPLIKTVASFKELNLEFLAAEGNAFTLDSPQSLPLLYAEDSSPDATRAKEQEHHRIANMLVTVCATLGELPHVRFDGTRTDAGTPREAAASVARILQDKLEALRANPTSGFPSRHLGDDERPTLLLLERSFDVVSPLLHEYTYQAMVHDLLPVHDDRYTYRYVGNNSQTISKEVLLNDSDPPHSYTMPLRIPTCIPTHRCCSTTPTRCG